jgi:hypothetical protein
VAETLQVLKGTSVQPRGLFYSDGALIDIDASGVPAVTITKPDGTAGPASGSVTRVSIGTYTFTLAATATAELTLYAITWTGNIGTQPQTITTYVEVVGAFLYTLAALRAVKVAGQLAFQSTTDYPNQTLLDRRVEVTDDFEARTGYSFIPRFARETFDGDGQTSLILSKYRCQRLLSVTIDGAAQTATDYTLADTGLLQRKTGGTFPATTPQNVVVEYVYGFARPPAEISEVALARAAMLLLPAQASSTASTWITPDGTSYSFDPAGRSLSGGGRSFYGVPKIDATLSDPAYNARRGGVFA